MQSLRIDIRSVMYCGTHKLMNAQFGEIAGTCSVIHIYFSSIYFSHRIREETNTGYHKMYCFP